MKDLSQVLYKNILRLYSMFLRKNTSGKTKKEVTEIFKYWTIFLWERLQCVYIVYVKITCTELQISLLENS